MSGRRSTSTSGAWQDYCGRATMSLPLSGVPVHNERSGHLGTTLRVQTGGGCSSHPGERTVIVVEPPPARAPSTRPQVLLGRTLRIVNAGPRPFFQLSLVSLAATAGLVITIALQIRPAGPLSQPQRDVI